MIKRKSLFSSIVLFLFFFCAAIISLLPTPKPTSASAADSVPFAVNYSYTGRWWRTDGSWAGELAQTTTTSSVAPYAYNMGEWTFTSTSVDGTGAFTKQSQTVTMTYTHGNHDLYNIVLLSSNVTRDDELWQEQGETSGVHTLSFDLTEDGTYSGEQVFKINTSDDWDFNTGANIWFGHQFGTELTFTFSWTITINRTDSRSFFVQTKYLDIQDPNIDAGKISNEHITLTKQVSARYPYVEDKSTAVGIVDAQRITLSGMVDKPVFAVKFQTTEKEQFLLDDIWGSKGKVFFEIFESGSVQPLATKTIRNFFDSGEGAQWTSLPALKTNVNYTIRYQLTFQSSYDETQYDIWEYTGTWNFNFRLIDHKAQLTSEGDLPVKIQDGIYYVADAFNVTVPSSVVNYTDIDYNGENLQVTYTSSDVSATLNGSEYVLGASITEEGQYVFNATDGKGYGETFTVRYDKSAPKIEVVDGDGNALESGAWFSNDITVKITDISPTTSTYGNKETSSKEFTITASDVIDGKVSLTVKDDVRGYTTSWEGKYFSSTNFDNEKYIKNAYKVPSWYNVRLPRNRFVALTEDKLNYSFATYDAALAFAKAMEEEHQVEPTANGWTYSTADNYSNRIVYTNRATLDIVIEKWVKGYISSEQTFSTGNNAYYNEPTSLTDNTVETPSALGAGYPSTAYFISPKYVFTTDAGRDAIGLTHTVTAQYIGEVIDGELKNTDKAKLITLVKDSVTFSQDLTAQGLNYQGFFLIKESDSALNEKSYLIYYDLTAPTMTLTGERGDAENNASVDVDISSYTGDVHFVKVNFGALLDNREKTENVLVKIEGRGYNGTLFNGTDEFPTLSAENDCYGRYVVTVYDRTGNEREIEFFVAPETFPGWSHSSLANEERLRLTFNANYTYNSIKELKIYKVSSNGTKTLLEKDDDNTPIGFTTLEYVFYTGGKYQAEIVDIYGRRVWTSAIFYKKGLPDGTLTGVQSGGATRRDVVFTCSDAYDVYVYVTDSGEKVVAETSLYQKTTSTGKTTITIYASDATSHRYVIAVHNRDNEEIFVEYDFEIDTVAADVVIYDATTDVELPKDGVAINGFYIRATEPNVSFTYYVNEYGIGANLKRYVAGTRLYTDGTYYFTAKDYLGNTREFTVLCDTIVSYEITGAHTKNESGVILAGAPVKFTVLEKFTDVVITRGMVVYDNAELLIDDGTYSVYAEDVHGNKLRLTIIIDQIAPVITLTGVANGGSTKEMVTVIFDEGSTCVLTNSKGGYLADVAQGQIFTADGSYYLLATDVVGNKTTANFYIRTKINVTSNIVNKQVTTDAVRVSFDNDVTVTIKRDGEVIDAQREYTEQGSYVILASDVIGNETTFEFVIIEKKYQEYELSLPTGWWVSSVWKDNLPISTPETYTETGIYTITATDGNGFYELILEIDATPPSVTIDVQANSARVYDASEQVVATVLYKNGVEVSYRVGNIIDGHGSYRLELTDDMGNTSVFEFEVPYALNVFAIIAIVVAAIIVLAIIIFLLKSKKIKI